jgi:hypothetical protein
MNQRSDGKGTDWASFGFALAILFMIALVGLAAAVVGMAVKSGERANAERHPNIVVGFEFLSAANRGAKYYFQTPGVFLFSQYPQEAEDIAERTGSTEADVEAKLR